MGERQELLRVRRLQQVEASPHEEHRTHELAPPDPEAVVRGLRLEEGDARPHEVHRAAEHPQPRRDEDVGAEVSPPPRQPRQRLADGRPSFGLVVADAAAAAAAGQPLCVGERERRHRRLAAAVGGRERRVVLERRRRPRWQAAAHKVDDLLDPHRDAQRDAQQPVGGAAAVVVVVLRARLARNLPDLRADPLEDLGQRPPLLAVADHADPPLDVLGRKRLLAQHAARVLHEEPVVFVPHRHLRRRALQPRVRIHAQRRSVAADQPAVLLAADLAPRRPRAGARARQPVDAVPHVLERHRRTHASAAGEQPARAATGGAVRAADKSPADSRTARSASPAAGRPARRRHKQRSSAPQRC